MENLPKRKLNRLKMWDYSNTAAYFITICTYDMNCILSLINVGNNAHIVPNILSKYGIIVKQYIENINNAYDNAIVDKYVIMPNHIHMIITIQSGTMRASFPTNIPSIVRSLKILTSKKCGFSIWQKSYYDHIIRDEKDYLRIWEYIENNVLKWELDKYYIGQK